MLSPLLLKVHPNKAVEDRYADNIIYRYLYFVCNPIMSAAKEYAIYPGELFYNCMYSLDSLKGLTKDKLREKSTTLLDEIYRYFNDKGLDKNNIEVQHAICLVAYSVERCLAFVDDPTYAIALSIIDMRLELVNMEYLMLLKKRFNKASLSIGDQRLKEYMCTYMHKRELLSNEIGDVIDLSMNITDVPTEKPTKTELEAVFTIAYIRSDNSHMLITFLRDESQKASDIDWARYALEIYNCKQIFSNRPQSFKEWLSKFGIMFNRSVAYREPNKMNRSQTNNSISQFLPN